MFCFHCGQSRCECDICEECGEVGDDCRCDECDCCHGDLVIPEMIDGTGPLVTCPGCEGRAA